jgi:hypothetical protein
MDIKLLLVLGFVDLGVLAALSIGTLVALPKYLRESIEKNCYRSDGSFSQGRKSREQEHLKRFRSGVLLYPVIILVAFNLVWLTVWGRLAFVDWGKDGGKTLTHPLWDCGKPGFWVLLIGVALFSGIGTRILISGAYAQGLQEFAGGVEERRHDYFVLDYSRETQSVDEHAEGAENGQAEDTLG